MRVLCEMNTPGLYIMHDAYEFVIETMLNSHFSNSIINAFCIKYVDHVRMAYYFQESWYEYDCIVISHMTPQS